MHLQRWLEQLMWFLKEIGTKEIIACLTEDKKCKKTDIVAKNYLKTLKDCIYDRQNLLSIELSVETSKQIKMTSKNILNKVHSFRLFSYFILDVSLTLRKN